MEIGKLKIITGNVVYSINGRSLFYYSYKDGVLRLDKFQWMKRGPEVNNFLEVFIQNNWGTITTIAEIDEKIKLFGYTIKDIN